MTLLGNTPIGDSPTKPIVDCPGHLILMLYTSTNLETEIHLCTPAGISTEIRVRNNGNVTCQELIAGRCTLANRLSRR